MGDASSHTDKPRHAQTEAELESEALAGTLPQDQDVEKSGSWDTATDVEGDHPHSDSDEHEKFKVTWEGPEDPANPYNWPRRKKGPIIAAASMITFVTPLASSMFAPGVPQVMRDFDSNSQTLAGFVVSVFLLGYVAGPLVCSPLSEMYGRTLVYHISMVGFVVFTVACGVAPDLNSLIAFRFLSGLFGSTPLCLGGGTIADLYIQEQRGGVMSIWAMGPMLGPTLGPVIGGFVSNSIGWRWVFYIIAIAAAVMTVFEIFVFHETYGPVLLERKAKKLRKETGDNRYMSSFDDGDSSRQKLIRAIIRPTKMLFMSPIVFALSLYLAVGYGYIYLLFTTMTQVFEEQYHFGAGVVGLSYLGIGCGMMLALFGFGYFSDKMVKQQKRKHGSVKPEVRLSLILPSTVAFPIGLFWYGWSAQARTAWIVPIIGTVFCGFAQIGIYMPINTYLIDAFTIHAASALAANTILRSVVGAVLPLAGQPLYAKLGLGWGNSLLAFIAIALAPVPVLFIKYGEYMRTSPRFQVKF